MPLALAGCRGNAQTDIVQREMRCQEDKIYAMEDYLAQYQQLLCEYRRENRQLRRQLAEGQSTETSPREPAPWRPERSEGPAMSAPVPAAPVEKEPAAPDVPPLEETSQNESSSEVIDLDPIDEPSDQEREVILASAEEPVVDEEVINVESVPVAGPPQQVWLDGEVIPSDEDAGTRVVVDVAPITADGGPATFTGELSLMFRDPGAQPGARSLARWDFSGDELKKAVDEAPGGETMRFYLELPGDVSVDRPVELWVRLLTDDGDKLLAHAKLDLRQAAPFSVRQSETAGRPLERPLAVAERAGWSRWQIARPGEATALAQRIGRPAGKWQTTTDPVPTVARQSSPLPAVIPTVANVEASDDRYSAPPTWSPSR